MAIYTVFQPPLRGEEAAPDPERFEFVRQGFHFWAMIFAPLWLLAHRLWLAFLGYVVLVPALLIGVKLLTGLDDVTTVVALLIALLMGFEAATLRIWTLERNGWRDAGTVIADDREVAEWRFLESRLLETTDDAAATPRAPAASPAYAPASAADFRQGASTNDVIGLFPGATR